MRAIVTVGISASGKSTWARNFLLENLDNEESWSIICRDDIRMQILNEQHEDVVFDGVRWDLWKWKDENIVTDRWWKRVEHSAKLGVNIILADTNLNRFRCLEMIARLMNLGYTVETKEFPITFEEALQRDALRPYGVGVSVLAKQWEQWNELQRGEMGGYENDTTKRSAIMVDMDGTLAHMDDKRKAYDWHKVHLDRVDIAVAELVRSMHAMGHVIVIMSGRDSACYDKTYDWLIRHHVPFHQLIMRAKDDNRKDAVVKRELFDKHVRYEYNVLMVIDDRPQVCDMWRDLGLKVLQCGNPYVRF